MTHEKFIQLLIKEVKNAGSQRALAEKLGVSPAYLGDVLHGRREPGRSILEPLGFRRVVLYEKA